jgi:hypothetical protein
VPVGVIEELDKPDTLFALDVRLNVMVSFRLPAVAVLALTERSALLPAATLKPLPSVIAELVFEPLTSKLSW